MSRGVTLLSLACARADVATVCVLLELGADPGWRRHASGEFSSHQDPFLLCLHSPRFRCLEDSLPAVSGSAAPLADRIEVARLLVENGARPIPAVVAEAAREGSAELLSIFLDATGGTAGATEALAVVSSKAAVERLISAGADVLAHAGAGCTVSATALISACRNTTRLLRCPTGTWDLERAEVVVALLAAVAPSTAKSQQLPCNRCNRLSAPHIALDARDSGHGRTALAWAALNGYAGAVRALLSARADCALTDKDGRTALELALSDQHDYGYYVDRTSPWHVKRMAAVVGAIRCACHGDSRSMQ